MASALCINTPRPRSEKTITLNVSAGLLGILKFSFRNTGDWGAAAESETEAEATIRATNVLSSSLP